MEHRPGARLKDRIYTSVGESIRFDSINVNLSTDLFAPNSHALLSDNLNKITLTVR